jgi:hypothetical protein
MQPGFFCNSGLAYLAAFLRRRRFGAALAAAFLRRRFGAALGAAFLRRFAAT